MKHLFIFITILLFIACKPTDNSRQVGGEEASKYETTGRVERIDPAIDHLIPEDAVIEVLAGGFTWTEGPLWIAEGDFLLFSDIPPNNVHRWTEEEGVTLYLHPSGYTGDMPRGGEPGSNGLLLDADGRLVLCQHGDRQVARMDAALHAPAPRFITLADQFRGARLNSPNDATYDSQGNLFFTDPPYGLEGNVDDPAKELDFQGVYRLSTSGRLDLISDAMSRPNGIGLSPDERTLYVANSDPASSVWMAFTLNETGGVDDARPFYDATGSEGKGLPDGLKVDPQGNVWATGPGGVWVFDATGKVLGKILTGEATSNCAFNDDFSVLYMTCDDYLMRIKLK